MPPQPNQNNEPSEDQYLQKFNEESEKYVNFDTFIDTLINKIRAKIDSSKYTEQFGHLGKLEDALLQIETQVRSLNNFSATVYERDKLIQIMETHIERTQHLLIFVAKNLEFILE